MSKENKPKITIITVCYNAANSIMDTIVSVVDQSCFNEIEYLIIDGNSIDGTLDIIQSHLSYIDKLISEPDKGIYDAMNKGILNASGEWILFLNAGDKFFEKDTLENVIKDLSGADVIYGRTMVRNADATIVLKSGYAQRVDWKVIPYCHQSVLIKREYLMKCLFNIEFKIAADYNQYFNLKKLNCRFKLVDVIISIYDNDGFSSNNTWDLLNEYRTISLYHNHGIYKRLKIRGYFFLKKILSKYL